MKTLPHLCVPYDEAAVSAAFERADYLIAEVACGGMRTNLVVDNVANAEWLSKTGREILSIRHLNSYNSRWKQLLKDDRCIFPDGFMLDGELMVKGLSPSDSKQLLISKRMREENSIPFALDSKRLIFRLFAVLPEEYVWSDEDYDVPNLLMPLHVEALCCLLTEYFPEVSWLVADSHDVYSMDKLKDVLNAVKLDGHAGLVIKDPTGIYRRGKHGGWWWYY